MHASARNGRPRVDAVRPTLLLVALIGSLPSAAFATQAAAGQDAWFGLSLPPGLQPHMPPAIIGDRGPVPAIVPAEEEDTLILTFHELAKQRKHVRTVNVGLDGPSFQTGSNRNAHSISVNRIRPPERFQIPLALMRDI